MHRFYLPPDQTRGAEIFLRDAEAHHAVDVLRVRAGERVAVLDGAGQELVCAVESAASGQVKLSVIHRNSLPALPYQITLLQAIPKGKIMESIIQKATELGAHRIVPLMSDRVVTQLDEEAAANRTEKWRQTAIEAIKQSGNAWLPRVETPVTPKEYVQRGEKFELQLIGSLQSDRRHPREYFRKFVSENNRLPDTVSVWVGPEGDFTPAEMNLIKGAGALPITLGRLVLRSETAAVYCLSALNYELESKGV